MPQPVAKLVEPARIVATAHPAFLVEVGDVGNFGPQMLAAPLRGSSSSPKFRANAIWRSSSRRWPRDTSTV